eukprot:scaffold281955_cov21-Tisochrysis_lutea.AAC.2
MRIQKLQQRSGKQLETKEMGCWFPHAFKKRKLELAAFMLSPPLTSAYRAAASMGIRRALLIGLLVIVVYYCGIATLVQLACGITHEIYFPLVAHVNQAQHRIPGSSAVCSDDTLKQNKITQLLASMITYSDKNTPIHTFFSKCT